MDAVPQPAADPGLDSDEARLEALLRDCARQDGAALERLYRLASPRLFGVLMAILRDHALAEDALQEVFVRIWQGAGQFDGYRGRAFAWMNAIARYHAIDLVRSRKRQAVPVADAAGLLDATGAQTPAARPESESTRGLLERCLDELASDQQRCLWLAYVDGYTQEEIASSVATPLGTVKSWIRRGLESLRRCMGR